MIKIYKRLLICQDSTFSMVAAMEITGQNVQCGFCHWNMESSVWSTELRSFHLGWISCVICTILNAVEAQGLSVWCICMCSYNNHSVSSYHHPWPEDVCVPNCTWLGCTNTRLENYDTKSIICRVLERERDYSYIQSARWRAWTYRDVWGRTARYQYP